jgi:hypothetical protein
MKIFILWVMLSSHGIAISNQEYNSLEACHAAELQLQKEFPQGGDWGDYSIHVKTSCTQK